jgi:hypothetical protein
MAITVNGGAGTPGGGPFPGKLGTAYSPILLYNFNGALTDAGSASENLTVARGSQLDVQTGLTGEDALFMGTAEGLDGATTPAPAAVRATGDITVEVVYTPIVEGIGSFGTLLFGCYGDAGSTSADNEMWMVLLENTASKLEPMFRYEHGTNTRVTTKDSPAHYMTPGVPNHIICRRWDAGGGSISTDIHINGTLIVTQTGQTACDGGGNAVVRIGRSSAGQIEVNTALYHSLKLVGRKLTDAEVSAEFALTGLTS